MTDNIFDIVYMLKQTNNEYRELLKRLRILNDTRDSYLKGCDVLDNCIRDKSFLFMYNPTQEPITMLGKPEIRDYLKPYILDSGKPVLMYYTTKGNNMYLVLGKDITLCKDTGEFCEQVRKIDGSRYTPHLEKGTLIILTKTEVSCILETYPEFFGQGTKEDETLELMKNLGQIQYNKVQRLTLGKLLLYLTEGCPMLDVDPNLYLAYIRFAKAYFTYTVDNKTICYMPTDVSVHWSSRMRTAAGSTLYRSRPNVHDWEQKYYDFKIKLSSPYHRKFPDETYSTLLHEMVHIFLPRESHSAKFVQEINRLTKESGYNVTLNSREAAVVNWYLYCPCCGSTFKRTNKPKYIYYCPCGSELEIYSVDDFAELVEAGVIATNETVTR